MIPEVKKAWVEALRSGEYVQGEGRLRTDPGGVEPDEFCCLGVLCDVVDPNGWTKFNEFVVTYADGEEEHLNTELSSRVLKELGMHEQDQGHLIRMNDDLGCGFDAIADWIEDNLFDPIADWIEDNL